MQQTTLNKPVTFEGIGLHSGCIVSMTLYPAEENAGIVFHRTDVSGKNPDIRPLWDNVVDTRLCTKIGNDDGVTVGTIEHLMAALRGCGVDNVRIVLDGPEVPVMDGSSAAFVAEIDRAGVRPLSAPRRVIRMLKTVSVARDGKKVSLSPAPYSSFGGEIRFDHPVIGRQSYEITLVNGNFRHDLADARTFCFAEEVEQLRKMGLARGGSLDNAIVLNREAVLNTSGLRYEDEFIRHKLLDAIGDLFLAGAPILGAYEGDKAGHEMNNALLHALFADETAYEIVEMGMESAASAPVSVLAPLSGPVSASASRKVPDVATAG